MHQYFEYLQFKKISISDHIDSIVADESNLGVNLRDQSKDILLNGLQIMQKNLHGYQNHAHKIKKMRNASVRENETEVQRSKRLHIYHVNYALSVMDDIQVLFWRKRFNQEGLVIALRYLDQVIFELRAKMGLVQEKLIYAGVGSRETPENMLIAIKMIAISGSRLGYLMQSGHADGADKMFELGVDNEGGKKIIYLPWKKFNQSDSINYLVPDEAYHMASKFHPVFDKLKPGAKNLLARDMQQVLGQNLDHPVDLVVAYAKRDKKGKPMGGTRMAILLAEEMGIPVVNLFDFESPRDAYRHVTELMKNIKKNKE